MSQTRKKDWKNFIRFAIFFPLFFLIELVEFIPIKLFHINVNTMSEQTLYLLTIFSKVILAALLLFAYRKELKTAWVDFKKNAMPYLDIAIKYWIVGLIIMAVSNVIIGVFSPVRMAENDQAVRSIIETTPFLALILTTILAPITEEMTFRKVFYDAFSHKWLFILVSGFTFGALHVLSSFTTLYSLLYIIPYSSLGLAFAAILCRTKNIFACISMHALHNGIITIMSILLPLIGMML